MKLYENGVYLVNGTTLIEDNHEASAKLAATCGKTVDKEEARKRREEDRRKDEEEQ